MNSYYPIFVAVIIFCCSIAIGQCQKEQCVKFPHKLNDSSDIIDLNFTRNQRNVVESFVEVIGDKLVFGRIAFIDNALSTVRILQPLNDSDGCQKNRTARTSVTTRMGDNCEVAVNAGFFHPLHGNKAACVGNVINRGKIYRNSGGIINAHFGIRKDGKAFFGYLGAADVDSGVFDSLVGGVIWLVRDGRSVVNESIEKECAASQETGSLSYFSKVVSARTAVGATSDGRLVLVHVEGRTSQGGVDLDSLAELLLKLGLRSAINLDGGGSATMVVNRTLVSYPSDLSEKCDNQKPFTCERPVSTVLCVSTRCPARCPKGTECRRGFCRSSRRFRSVFTMNSAVAIGVSVIGLILFLIAVSVAIYRLYQQSNRLKLNRQNRRDSKPCLVMNIDQGALNVDTEPLMYSHDADFIREF